MRHLIALLIIGALGWYGLKDYQRRKLPPPPVEVQAPQPAQSRAAEPKPPEPRANPAPVQNPVTAPAPEAPVASAFKCDGRTRCSQMTSCREATFFIQNCPNTEMDGDGDGVPCESQWCQAEAAAKRLQEQASGSGRSRRDR